MVLHKKTKCLVSLKQTMFSFFLFRRVGNFLKVKMILGADTILTKEQEHLAQICNIGLANQNSCAYTYISN